MWLVLRWRGTSAIASAGAGLAIVLAAVSLYSALQPESPRAADDVENRELSTDAETFQTRQAIWKQAATAVLENPAGYGYQHSIHGGFIQPITAGGAIGAKTQSVHQQVLAQLVDGGILGFALFLVIPILMIRAARELPPAAAGLRFGFSALLVAAAVGSLVGTVLQSAACATVLWFAFGVALGWRRRPVSGWASAR
jgi:O-antigen ligase